MFLNFLVFLRSGGIKVSMHDWLSLTEGLYMGLHGQTLDGFFVLSRALLVKTESDLDKYEELFYRYFKNVNSEKLKKEMEKLQQQPDAAREVFEDYIGSRDLDPQTVLQTLEMRLDEDEPAPAESAGEVQQAKGKVKPGIGVGPGNGAMTQGAGGRSVVHARGDRVALSDRLYATQLISYFGTTC